MALHKMLIILYEVIANSSVFARIRLRYEFGLQHTATTAVSTFHGILKFQRYIRCLQTIGTDFPGAVGANAPMGKSSVGACTQRFLPARRYASAGLCDSNVSVCPSVCPSRAGIVSKRRNDFMISSPSCSPLILVFWYQISSRHSKGFPSGSVKQGRGG